VSRLVPRTIVALLLAVLTATSLLGAAPASAAEPPAVGTVGARFGLNLIDYGFTNSQTATDYTLDQLVATGVAWVRYPVAYSARMDWRNHDRFFAAAKARGLQVDLVLVGSTVPTPDAYAGYCADVVNHWPGQVDAIEVWNEPNYNRFWGGATPDPVAFAALAEPCSQAVRAASPQTTILAAGLAPRENNPAFVDPSDYFARVLAAGYHTFDALAFHPYSGCASYTEGDARWGWQEIAQLRTVLGDAGFGNRLIWLTEYGVAGAEAGNTELTCPGRDEAWQAQNLTEFARWCSNAPGIGVCFWYQWRDGVREGTWVDTIGIVDRAGRLKPAYYALQQATSMRSAVVPSLARAHQYATTIGAGLGVTDQAALASAEQAAVTTAGINGAAGILVDASLPAVVDGLYMQLLDRHATSQEAAAGAAAIRTSGNRATVVGQIAGTPEFRRLAGGTNTGIVSALYVRLAGRPADLGGLQFWTAQLAGGQSPSTVATAFWTSSLSRAKRAVSVYQRTLGRTPTATESAWATQVLANADEGIVEQWLLTQAEALVRGGL
jgi:hypothetical protein